MEFNFLTLEKKNPTNPKLFSYGQLNLVESSYGAEAPSGYKLILPITKSVQRNSIFIWAIFIKGWDAEENYFLERHRNVGFLH
jgi:hypothetical protein